MTAIDKLDGSLLALTRLIGRMGQGDVRAAFLRQLDTVASDLSVLRAEMASHSTTIADKIIAQAIAHIDTPAAEARKQTALLEVIAKHLDRAADRSPLYGPIS